MNTYWEKKNQYIMYLCARTVCIEKFKSLLSFFFGEWIVWSSKSVSFEINTIGEFLFKTAWILIFLYSRSVLVLWIEVNTLFQIVHISKGQLINGTETLPAAGSTLEHVTFIVENCYIPPQMRNGISKKESCRTSEIGSKFVVLRTSRSL